MEHPISEILSVLNGQNQKKKYYVYRLIDPRTLQTFYVGKGSGDRVYQHVKNVQSLLNNNKDIDAVSLKAQQIAEILACGKQVISIIHRWGLTEKEAFEVEAALIDAYPRLTNIQSGHGSDRGAITLEDFEKFVLATDYFEPSEKYIIVKTTTNAIQANGSLYDATRQSWKANLNKAKQYKYVLSVIGGIVQEVYEVEIWYQEPSGRIAFNGVETTDPDMRKLIGKRIPAKYRQKGAANPFVYKK